MGMNQDGTVKNKRYIEIDIAKGVGIILVIIGHVLGNESVIREYIYTFHMPLFFFLSGFVIRKNKINEQKTILITIRNNLSLIVHYIIWSIAYLILDLIFVSISHEYSALRILFVDIYETICLYGISVLWFIATLIFSRIITEQILQRFSVRYSIVLCIILLVAGTIGGSIVNTYLNSKWYFFYPACSILRIVMSVPIIYMGYLSRDALIKLLNAKLFYNLTICVLSSAMLIILVFLDHPMMDYHKMAFHSWFTLIYFALGILSIVCLTRILKAIKAISCVLAWLGKNSLLIMVTHETIIRRILALVLINCGYTVSNVWIRAIQMFIIILLEMWIVYFCGDLFISTNKSVCRKIEARFEVKC